MGDTKIVGRAGQVGPGGPSRAQVPVSVLIVEPLPLMASAIQMSLSGMTAVGTVGIAHDAATAGTMMQHRPVDLVVTDLTVPTVRDGLKLCRWLRQRHPRTRVLVFSTEHSTHHHSMAVTTGVHGYVHKGVSPTDLQTAVARVLSGVPTWWLTPRLPSPETATTEEAPSTLTLREREVHSLLLQRLTNAEIAEELSLAEQTVKNYVSGVLRKVGAKNRRDLHRRRGDGQGPGPARMHAPGSVEPQGLRPVVSGQTPSVGPASTLSSSRRTSRLNRSLRSS